ncbi:chemotaxis-specific protein-glutamate methyltransferase CheB [Vulgatibacter incomptus]|uniref:Protein-glutamate methylesterase/protein-glutamine glutaminase n=1 Tax=Vulgatibacter incomptus TaxID=1391653 RepID=A0A0K1PFU6_9BACT|nr:chemotaxis-specific protein-glutamate methyltransferase CheB [Vulgatibacter incomptus]AKU92408.1 Chemotaxis response regulator protein-glutamate methylesterase CheB [Vulgatibacter incomptus]
MTPQRKVRVLVADDSPVVREFIVHTISGSPDLEVVATAASGDEAAELTVRLSPDVITMDLQMPGSDGFAGIARVMAEKPTPILVLSSNREEVKGFRALDLGALDLMEKPVPESMHRFGAELTRRLRLLATVPVIRHLRGLRKPSKPVEVRRVRAELVVIGASLGGPKALAALLGALPADFPVPIAVVQHISGGFTEGFARWLCHESGLDVKAASDGAALAPGRVFIGADDFHLTVERDCVRLVEGPAVSGFKPSATPLFASAARSFGPKACGVILTGMGRDGAEGMRELKRAGALTIAQDEATCAVFGMPHAAIELGAIDRVLPLDRIAPALLQVVR